LLLNYVVLSALWKIDVHLISTLVNKVFIIFQRYSAGTIVLTFVFVPRNIHT